MIRRFNPNVRLHASSDQPHTDLIGLVGFHNLGFNIVEPMGAYEAELQQEADRLAERIDGRGTNITAGLRCSLAVLRTVPANYRRRIWLLSDGFPNREVKALDSAVQEALRDRVGVHAIGFGDLFDRNLLRRIANATPGGRFVSVHSLRGLTDAFLRPVGSVVNRRQRTRPEATVLALDLSRSMRSSMEEQRKIDVVHEAILRLLAYKQRCYS